MYFFGCIFSINYNGFKGEAMKLVKTILYDRYYTQNCKAITFKKSANHTTYYIKHLMFQGHDHMF